MSGHECRKDETYEFKFAESEVKIRYCSDHMAESVKKANPLVFEWIKPIRKE